MKIATWNINGMKARLDFVRHWLRHADPDVVGLQELKCTNEQFPHDAFEELGYRALVHGQKAWNGVAILSKHPAEITQQGLPGQHDFGARLLTASVQSGTDAFSFTTIYCPNGKSIDHEDFGRKLQWYDSLLDYVQNDLSPDQPTILCGDFNIVPTGLDSWREDQFRGRIFHTDAERERIAKLKAWGFVDAYRDLTPDEPGFSWWDYRAGSFHKNQGLRIDLVLVTKSIRERVTEVGRDRDWRKKYEGLIASDHAPVWCRLT